MSIRQFCVTTCLLTLAFSGLVQGAEFVVILPGSGGTSTQVPVFSANPFNPTSTIVNATPSAFQVIQTPDGQKNYLIANTGTQGITVYDQNFSNGQVISGSLSLAPTAVGLSPDGKRLVVLAGRMYIFDTATNTLLNPAGFALNGTLVDLAFSVDGARVYVLGNSGTSGIVTPVDLVTNSTGTPLTLPGAGTGIALGPNGLLYVTTPNRLYEINPRTLTVTPSGEFPVNATPSKPVFTPDGRYALAINRVPITGSSLLMFDLLNHTLAAAFPNFGVTLDRLVVAGANRIFGYSSQNNTIYDITVQTGLNINPSALLSVIPQNVGGFAVSNEIPSRTIYITGVASGQNTLYKVDLTNNTIVGQFVIPNNPGQIVGYANANPTSGGTVQTALNASQIVPAGQVALPLVVRVQDSLGRPVFGARVDFTTTATGAFLSQASAFTNSEGFAQTLVTAPTTPGQFTVNAASAGTQPVSFTLTVPGTGGGGGGNTLASIRILSGNGQIVPEQFLATQPLTVLVTDASGNPAPNVPVTFNITQGKGTILGSTTTTVNTDNLGQASSPFLATSVDPGFSFQQATINAASSVGSVNFTITTTLQTLQGGGAAGAPNADLIEPDFSSNPQRLLRGGAGQVLRGAIKVQVYATSGPGQGQPIPNVAVTVGPLEGEDPTKVPSAKCVNDPLTDVNGIASCDLQFGNILGAAGLRVNVGGLKDTAPVQILVTVGPPARVIKTAGDTQSGRPGQTLPTPFQIRVVDSANNALPNIPLRWEVIQGNATLTATNTITNNNGVGSTTVTLGQQPGTTSIRVTAGSGTGAPTATFTATVEVTVGGLTLVGGDNQTANTGQAFAQPLEVLVTSDTNTPLGGVPVSFSLGSGLASLSANSVTTNSAGRASVNVTAGGAPGPITIIASVGSRTVTFNLTSRLPGPPVNTNSFVNAASGFPGLTPCGIALAQAPGLVPGVSGTLVANAIIGPLPFTLGNADITVNGVPAPFYYVTNGAIAFQVPCETQPGLATVVVRVSGGTTTVQGVQVFALMPGIFETVIEGRKYAVLQRVSDGSYITPQNPARPGDRLRMFVTGLGAVSPATGTGRAGLGGQNVLAALTAGVNDSGVQVLRAEYLAGEVGVYVVEFEIPANSQTGPYQNVALAATGADGQPVFGNGSFLPIF